MARRDAGPGQRGRGRGAGTAVGVAAGLLLLVATVAALRPGAAPRPLLPLEPIPAGAWDGFRTADAVEPAELQAGGLRDLAGTVAAVGLGGAAVAVVTALSLLTASAASRRREMAVRGALGATRLGTARSLARDRLPALLRAGGVGALAGTAVGLASRAAWPFQGPAPLLDGPGAAGAVVLVGGLAALWTALPARGVAGPLAPRLAAGTRATGDAMEGGVRRLLLVGQIAACAALVAGGIVLVRADLGGGTSSAARRQADEDTLVVPVRFADADLAPEERARRWRAVLAALSASPGIEEPGLASPGAWRGLGVDDFVLADCGRCSRGMMPTPFVGEPAHQHVAEPGFFSGAGLELLRGRTLSLADTLGAEPVAVVSERFARINFERGIGVGRHLMPASRFREPYRVVGVVRDPPRTVLGRTGGVEEPAVWLSALQHPPREAELAARGRDGPPDPEVLLDPVRAAGLVPTGPVRSLAALRARDRGPGRWAGALALLAGAVASLAALLGAVELARVDVAARRRELATRAAVGADPGRLRREVLARAAGTAAVGVLLGVPAAVAVAVAAREAVGDVPLFDPVVYLAVSAALVGAVVRGSLGAAREAQAVEPARALAEE